MDYFAQSMIVIAISCGVASFVAGLRAQIQASKIPWEIRKLRENMDEIAVLLGQKTKPYAASKDIPGPSSAPSTTKAQHSEA